MFKRKTLILSGIAAVVLISAFAAFIAAGGNLFSKGVNHIKIRVNDSGERILFVDYGFGMSHQPGYSVRVMDQGEEVFLGERLVQDDGLLGKYRIEILFHDIRASHALVKYYPLGTVHELYDVSSGLKSKYRIRIAYPPDDSSFVVYIGSDEPIDVSDKDLTRLGSIWERIEIPLG